MDKQGKISGEPTHTENISTLSPFGSISPRILSITMSFDEEATRCSPIVYGDGSASCKIYGLKRGQPTRKIRIQSQCLLVANHPQLKKKVHQAFPGYSRRSARKYQSNINHLTCWFRLLLTIHLLLQYFLHLPSPMINDVIAIGLNLRSKYRLQVHRVHPSQEPIRPESLSFS